MDYEKTFSTISRLANDLDKRGFLKLPAERQLAERLNTSRSVVRRVLEKLEEEGTIRRVRGRSGGSFLVAADSRPDDTFAIDSTEDAPTSARRVERTLDSVVGLPQMLRAQGFESGSRLISAGYEHASAAEQEHLQMDGGDLVAVIVRLRFADGDSLSLESFRVPAARFPGLLEQSLTESMYELLDRVYKVKATQAHEQIDVTYATPRVAAMLGVRDQTPMLRVTRCSEDQYGLPFERSVDLFRADRTILSVTAHQGGGVQIAHGHNDLNVGSYGELRLSPNLQL